jgi:hypothetical protein
MRTGAHERAETLDGGVAQTLSGLALPSLRDSVAQIRTYLQKQDADLGHRNNVLRILKIAESHGSTSTTRRTIRLCMSRDVIIIRAWTKFACRVRS